MQLTFETERPADLKDMSTLEESLDDKLATDAIIDSLKQISYGNKENIQKQDNISRNENGTVNNNKLEDEKLSEPAVKEESKQDSEEEILDEDDAKSSSEEFMDNELPDTNESHGSCMNAEKVQINIVHDECGQEDVSNSLQNTQRVELELIKQEVDDILAEQVSNLTNNVERENVHQLKSMNEELNIDTIKEAKENLIESIETGQLIENDVSFKETLRENSTSVEDGLKPIVSCVTETPEIEVAGESEVSKELVSEVLKDDEPVIDKEENASKCLGTEEDKSTSSCMKILTTQEETDDIVDKTVPEPMNVDDVGKEVDKISYKEENEITLLDSPVNPDIFKLDEENNTFNTAMECDDITEIVDKEAPQDAKFVASKDEVMIIDKEKENSQNKLEEQQEIPPQNQIEKEPEKVAPKKTPVICRLSNSLNILSDDEDEPPKVEPPKEPTPDKQCINLEDDDDIMLIDEDTNSKDSKTDSNKKESSECRPEQKPNPEETDLETGEKTNLNSTPETSLCTVEDAPSSTNEPYAESSEKQNIIEEPSEKVVIEKPLLPENFLRLSKKNVADMTREELEEFCILKIVESIVDRSNLSEIKTKLKAMAQSLEDYKKKAMMLTKQNRDLEVVLKSVQEEQKRTSGTVVTPLKITRSVGMQVYMTDKLIRKKPAVSVSQVPAVANNKTRSTANLAQKPAKVASNPTIPVPRLIPANNAAIRGPVPQSTPTSTGKQVTSTINGVRNAVPVQKNPEKRPLSKVQSVTVDLTDDEPPTKMTLRSPAAPVRLVPSQNLLAPQRTQLATAVNSPRKVYIPISGPQGQPIKPGQTIMFKTSPPGPSRQRPIAPNVTRLTPNQIRLNRLGQTPRHPAALPDAMKQYQPPNWKALPPAPDLKLSKVENGIVISWKIEGYQEDSYEEIASYQLYAYQETSSPPSTTLWKKIGDVKALPLPMACTLTQFMAGFKYYFAVRAVDVKSRLGPFSLPGSILLLNKM